MTTEAYIGSLWHQFNDPFVTVVGYNEAEVKQRLDEAAEDQWNYVLDSYEEGDEPEYDIMTSGVMLEFDIGKFLLTEDLEDLEADHLITV
jgi:hypothetical protein